MDLNLTTAPARAQWIARLQRWSPLATGALLGIGPFLWTHQYLATFGVSVAVTAAMALALAAGASLGLGIGQGRLSPELTRWIRPASWLVTAVWTVAFSWLLAAGRSVLGLVSVETLTSEPATFCLLLPIAAGLFVIPVAGLACLACDRSPYGDGDRSPVRVRPSFLLGTAIGLASAAAVGAPLIGLSVLTLIALACSGGGFWISLARPSNSTVALRPVPAADRSGTSLWVFGLSLLIGLEVPIVARLVRLLTPNGAYEQYALWGGLIAGTAVGLSLAQRSRIRDRSAANQDAVIAAAIVATVWPVGLLCVWPLLVHGFLTINAGVAFVPLVMLIRATVAAASLAPLGIALGRMWGDDEERLAVASRISAVGVLWTTAGLIVMPHAPLPPSLRLAAVATVAMCVAAARYWVNGVPTLSRLQKAAGAMAVLAIAVLPAARRNDRPDLAARLLFSTQTFSAMQSGIDRELLPHLDDGRLVRVVEGRSSTWTIWKHRGSQISLRENGIPRGLLSSDARFCPQFAGEIMPAVLPMVIHPRPQSVMVLGLGSTAPLTSVLACPVQSVTCVERDASLIRIVDEEIAQRLGVNPLDDDRLRLQNVDPTLALLASGPTYDTIIVNDGQASVSSALAGFTREFYQAARGSLHEDGLLCQRLQYADLGRGPIEDLLATVQSVFPQVALFDAAPGEMLIIAKCDDAPLVDAEVVERCEAPQIRRLTGQIGWDWSILLNIGAVGPDEVADLVKTSGTPNAVANGRFAYRLPQEVMRWSPPELPKWQERQTLLSARGSRMLSWIGDEQITKDVEQRLADVIEQQRLIVDHPDHFWAYRKTLKDRLTERPRSVIQQVKGEGLKRLLHPEDDRRKEYLEVLGAAATSTLPPDLESVRKLSEFSDPYDPLVSYFLHQESARLYERATFDDPGARLNHWRYSVYFAPPRDQSVRNVIAALEILNDHPDLIKNPIDRWDELNALLEVLKHRSALRIRFDSSASSFELIDAERSIAVAKRTVATMDKLRPQTDVSSENWERRKTVIERMLIRPMWSYQDQQAQRLAQQQAKRELLSAERERAAQTR